MLWYAKPSDRTTIFATSAEAWQRRGKGFGLPALKAPPAERQLAPGRCQSGRCDQILAWRLNGTHRGVAVTLPAQRSSPPGVAGIHSRVVANSPFTRTAEHAKAVARGPEAQLMSVVLVEPGSEVRREMTA
jgi:hypothetical protein